MPPGRCDLSGRLPRDGVVRADRSEREEESRKKEGARPNPPDRPGPPPTTRSQGGQSARRAHPRPKRRPQGSRWHKTRFGRLRSSLSGRQPRTRLSIHPKRTSHELLHLVRPLETVPPALPADPPRPPRGHAATPPKSTRSNRGWSSARSPSPATPTAAPAASARPSPTPTPAAATTSSSSTSPAQLDDHPDLRSAGHQPGEHRRRPGHRRHQRSRPVTINAINNLTPGTPPNPPALPTRASS